MAVPSNIDELLELIAQEIIDNNSGLIEEHTLRYVLNQLVRILDTKVSLISPTLTADQLAMWKRLADFKASDFIGSVTTSTIFPNAKSWGFAGPGTYTNADDLVISTGNIGVISFDGSDFTKVELPLPQAINNIPSFQLSNFPLVGSSLDPVQRIHKDSIWQLEAGETSESYDVPGLSEKWKNISSLNAVDFTAPKIPFLQGSAYDQDGNLLTISGFASTEKYFTKPGAIFKNDFAGIGFAVRAVYFNNNEVVGFKAVGTTDDIVIPAGVNMVAFNRQHSYENVTVQSVFWAIQEDAKQKTDLQNEISSLQTVISSQENQIDKINEQLDQLSDGNAPYFIDIGNILKSYGGISNPSHTTIYNVTRVNNYDISGDFSTLDAPIIGICIKTTDRHLFYSAKKISNTLLRTTEILPASFTELQTTLGDAQHLSRFGCLGLGEAIAESVARKRKVKYLSALSQGCQPYEKDFIKNGQTLLTINRLPNTAIGDYIAPGILASCEMYDNDASLKTGSLFKNQYRIAQNLANTGINFSIPLGGFSGFLQINLGEHQDNQTPVTVEIKNQDATVLFTESFRSPNRYINLDFDKSVTQLNVTIKSSNAGLFIWALNSVEVFQDYNDYATTFKKDHKAVFVMDSWGVFSLVTGGEQGFTNPLGIQMPGLGSTPKRYKDHLQSQGYSVQISNYSRGGMTVRWADFHMNTFLDNENDLDGAFIFMDFAINDSNSREYLNQVDTAYDFSPTDPYSSLSESQGGIKGAITLDQHINYYKSAIKKIVKRGGKPVLLINGLIGQNFGMIDTLVAQLTAELNNK